MHFSLYQKRLTYIYVQRNILAGAAVVFLIIILLQTLLLFFKKERIIVSPPELHQSYWVEENRFSKNYLEEMALFFSHLMLDVTEANIIPQGEILLRYVQPTSYGDFKAKLFQDEKRLKRQQLSLQFTPITIEMAAPLTMDVSGFLVSYIGAKKVSQFQETYRVIFAQNKGRLFLDSFQMIKSEHNSHDENQ